jgi:hypothetical protein
MFIAMNRFRVKRGAEDAFEKVPRDGLPTTNRWPMPPPSRRLGRNRVLRVAGAF